MVLEWRCRSEKRQCNGMASVTTQRTASVPKPAIGFSFKHSDLMMSINVLEFALDADSQTYTDMTNILCICMLLTLLSGCTDDGNKKADDKESEEQNNNSGDGGIGTFSGGALADVPSLDSILNLAEKYYKETEPNIESGFGGAFMRLVPKTPDFSGKTKDEDYVLETSFEVALTRELQTGCLGLFTIKDTPRLH